MEHVDIDLDAAARLLDELRPDRDGWRDDVARDHYYGATAMLETLGLSWCQGGDGRHAVSCGEPGYRI